MRNTGRTFWQVWTSGEAMTDTKRYPKVLFAMQAAERRRRENPGTKVYVTQSIGRFSDNGYEAW